MRQRFEIATADRQWIKQTGWRSVDDVLSSSSDDVAAVSRTSDVVEVPLDPALGGPASVFVKRYRYDRLVQRIKQAFRGTLFGRSRARREYEFLIEMCRRRVPTVRPIAFGELRGLLFLRAASVITEGTAGFRSLDIFALDAARSRGLGRSERNALVLGLARTVRGMHDAGVRHGGLFWRNILVRPESDGGFEFALLDPDTHARLCDSQVPWADAESDLAELTASGMALGLRGGLLAFMKAYFGSARLSPDQRRMVAGIAERARPLVSAEQRRMAVTEAIDWLRKRVVRAKEQVRPGGVFRTLDEFFDTLPQDADSGDCESEASRSVLFSFRAADRPDARITRCVSLANKRLTLNAQRAASPDLVVRTDPETWLSVVAGGDDACARLRAGRLRMEGDTRLLPELLEALDGQPEETPADRTREAGACRPEDESAGRTGVPATAGRSFGRKYKADQYAHYYAEKHSAGFGRRMSNEMERRMIRRALRRIQRRRPFHSVLDCPSGTGRFLPTLAELDVSVIAMDASDAMLREGRKYRDLFRIAPAEVVGSALALPLRDKSVDVVLCSRLLHHIPESEDRLTILREFARVARVGVVISFFDAACFRAWKRRRKTLRTGKPSGRHSMSRSVCAAEGVAAGLEPIGMNALLRFHTEITAAAFLC